MAAALLLLLCAGAVLSSVEAQDSYVELSNIYKQGVDLALEQLASHSSVQHHFRFLRTIAKSALESGFGVSYIYHHFYLKPTTCPKGTTDTNAQRCRFRNDRPLMDCAVCYKAVGDHIQDQPNPYVHCIQKPRLTEEMRTARTNHCKKMSYSSGAPTLLAVSKTS